MADFHYGKTEEFTRSRGENRQNSLTSAQPGLDAWLQAIGSKDHPAYWILGYLLGGDAAERLLGPPPDKVTWPRVHFDPPEGCRVKAIPVALNLFKKRKYVGSIQAWQQSTFERHHSYLEHRCTVTGTGLVFDPERKQFRLQDFDRVPEPGFAIERYDWTSGAATGRKYVLQKIGPPPSLQIDYALSVPGGFVVATLMIDGLDFDVAPFEAQLHTLSVSGDFPPPWKPDD